MRQPYMSSSSVLHLPPTLPPPGTTAVHTNIREANVALRVLWINKKTQRFSCWWATQGWSVCTRVAPRSFPSLESFYRILGAKCQRSAWGFLLNSSVMMAAASNHSPHLSNSSWRCAWRIRNCLLDLVRQSLKVIPRRGCSHTALRTCTLSSDTLPVHVGASSQGSVLPKAEQVGIEEVRYTKGLLDWLSAFQGEN